MLLIADHEDKGDENFIIIHYDEGEMKISLLMRMIITLTIIVMTIVMMMTDNANDDVSVLPRALFDYEPGRDSDFPGRGLTFKHGDILHVVNASDDEWWQAKKLVGDVVDQGVGIIPSKKRSVSYTEQRFSERVPGRQGFHEEFG